MKIAIIGSEGYVGKGMVNLFKDHYEIVKNDINLLNSATKEEVNQCDLAVICVPTPMQKNGDCDWSIVEEIISWLFTPVIWVRSTIPPGTTEYLKETYKKRIVFSPEYMGEGKYWSPYKFHNDEKEIPFVVLGGDKQDTSYILDLLVPILGPTKEYRQTDSRTAEIVKYWENFYFALKIVFANEMYEVCKTFEVNYWEARDLWSLDPRVDRMHTAVFPNARGYGGKCLPKDTNALVKACAKEGYNAKFLKAIIENNERFYNQLG